MSLVEFLCKIVLMQEENYIQIFTTYLANKLEKGEISLPAVMALVKEFEKRCDNIHNRSDLIAFINVVVGRLPQLDELKQQLQDPNFIFNK